MKGTFFLSISVAVTCLLSLGQSEEAKVQSVHSDQADHPRLKRGLAMLRLGKRDSADIDNLAELLYQMRESEELGAGSEGEDPEEVEELEVPAQHPRVRRSAQSPTENPHHEVLENSSNVEEFVEHEPRLVDDSYFYVFPDGSEELEPSEGGEDADNFDELEKRSMKMLRLGRSATDDDIFTNDKRQLKMLRLGKRGDASFDEEFDDEMDKRSLKMLRLGKRPMNMLRLGKRPMNMLRLGKRPMNMLRLGKRPMNMLRLGKRPMNMLRLGKRPMNMLRLGKRPMNMLRLGKRPADLTDAAEDEKRSMKMLRLGKRSAH